MSNRHQPPNILLNGFIAAHVALAAALVMVGISQADEGKPAAAKQDAQSKAAPAAKAAKPRIDLAFCIDTTGSMQAEIDEVKAKTREIVARLSGAKPTPAIRVGLVAFRDKGDEYVTKVFPFTEDIDKVVKDISSLKAQGGGDAPEAVSSALNASVNELDWDQDKKTLKLLFLIGDAGPNDRTDSHDWRAEASKAIARGIQINTIGCDGLQHFPQKDGVGVFQEIARLADGKFEYLSYKQEVARADGSRGVVVHSGGRAYSVSPSASWREGAASLKAKGAAMEAERHPAAMPLAAGRVTAAGVRGRGDAGSGAAAGFSAAPGFSRRDNNLADMVLGATKEAASKKMDLEFESR